MISIDGLNAIVGNFDLFLIDQFGVLHDGVKPYPHAIETLEALQHKNKRVVIVSNSGKRSSTNVRRLLTLGFGDTLFDSVVTSGEVAFNILASKSEEVNLKSCFPIIRGNDTSVVGDLDLRIADKPAESDFILISGCEPECHSEMDYQELLQPAAECNVKCICTNPDKKMLTDSGVAFGAGRIAEIYAELGGTVDWIGKPFPAIYKHIVAFYSGSDAARTICIGDSIEHDIAGGRNAGFKTLLVKTGIIANVTLEQLQGQFIKYDVTPDFIVEKFVN